VTVDLSWGALYDSNVLKYSPRDRNLYIDKAEKSPSSIRSLDDLRTDYKIAAEYRNKFWGKRITALRGTANFAHHAMNPIKNLGWVSLNGRQDFAKQWIGSVNFFYEPRYYIRDFQDINTDAVQHCRFALTQWKEDLTWRPHWLYELTVSNKFKQYRYNEYFTEYDGDLWEIGIAGVLRPEKWRFSAGYTYGVFENTGFNSSDLTLPGSFLNDSEFGQADFEENTYALSARRSFKLHKRSCDLEVAVDLADRYYTTTRDYSIDPMHSERFDRSVSCEISGRAAMTDAVSIEIGLGEYQRKSRAPAKVVSQVKDYNRWTAWSSISYEIQ